MRTKLDIYVFISEKYSCKIKHIIIISILFIKKNRERGIILQLFYTQLLTDGY